MPDHFPPDSLIRKVSLEPALLFGAGRALLLQLAFPAVARGVDDHSDFKRNPFKRLQGTLEATFAVVFGSDDLARRVGQRIQWIHDHVVGPSYQANDPANLLWVHATLVDTAMLWYEAMVDELSPDERQRYYDEMAEVAVCFGLPRDQQPATVADFTAYVHQMVAEIEVTDTGRELAGFILDPTLPLALHVPLRPLLSLQRRFTLATVPPTIRDQLGHPWDDRDQRRFERAERVVRTLYRATPRAVRTAGNRLGARALLWQAERHVRRFEEQQRRRSAAARTEAA